MAFAHRVKKPSLVFYFGIQPLKFSVELPSQEILTKEEFEHYYGDESGITDDGVFKSVETKDHAIIYLFCFKYTQQCSVIGNVHYKLPLRKRGGECYDVYSKESRSGIGNIFFHLEENVVVAHYSTDEIEMKYAKKCKGSNFSPDVKENDRQSKLEIHLQKYLAEKFSDIHVETITPSKNYAKTSSDPKDYVKYKMYCPFSGGGDTLVTRASANKSLVLMTHTLTEMENNSPTSCDEDRSALNLEYKSLSTMSNEDMVRQLKANMYHSVSKLFAKQVTGTVYSQLEQCQKLTIYGIGFGIGKMVIVLKLIIDFTQQILVYEEKFFSREAYAAEATVDCCIDFVVERLAKRSPSPDTQNT